MVYTFIKRVYDVFFISRTEFADTENAKEILKDYSGMDKIPVRLIVLENDKEVQRCIVLAGEGALYPWKNGQRVGTDQVNGVILLIQILHDLCVRGFDNSKYQNFILYDTIVPLKPGQFFANDGDKKYKGLLSKELYLGLADVFINQFDSL